MGVSLNQLVHALAKNGGSDLMLATGSPAMFGVRGLVIPVKMASFTGNDVKKILASVMDEALVAKLESKKNIDFSFFIEELGCCRVNAYYQQHGLSAVLRLLPAETPTLKSLNLPEICTTACSYANGLILVAGPGGCGKTTTIAAMINHINMTKNGHIITIEDPIEFRHPTKLCMMNQRALGIHFTTFASALRAALRQDPDVIMVGEMRDLETMQLAIKAAETGHLVFSTLHTSTAPKVVNRIINSFPPGEQSQVRIALSEALRVVICQQLVPTPDRQSRICFREILVNNVGVGNLIRDGKTDQLVTAMQTGKNTGMQVMDKELLKAVNEGLIDGRDAWEFADDKSLFIKFDPDYALTDKKAG